MTLNLNRSEDYNLKNFQRVKVKAAIDTDALTSATQ